MLSPAGQFYNLPSLYTFSRTLNWLQFNSSYPKDPATLGEYIRKWRMDKGLLIRELAAQLDVTEDTVINWEIRAMMPGKRHVEKLTRRVEGVEKWLCT